MGYDMYLIKTPADGSDGYFRLNIWGMSMARDLMAERGMLCSAEPSGDWPRCPDNAAYEWVKYPDDRQGAQPSPEAIGAAEVYIAEQKRYLSAHEGECPGIPVHKFGSNDGWIVTPPECIAALAALGLARDKGIAEPDAKWWPEWIAYLHLAAEHDGFEVW